LQNKKSRTGRKNGRIKPPETTVRRHIFWKALALAPYDKGVKIRSISCFEPLFYLLEGLGKKPI